MPIKKDGTGTRWVEMEIVVPGTPEQVWHALATGPGTTAWFTKTTIDERVGGEVRFDFGPQSSSVGEVTAWDPPRRFGYVERNWSEGAPPVATEITITGRSGSRSVVRMVHSLFASTDDWDDQMEGFEKGWPSFFEVLHVYLTHFAGRPASSLLVMETVDGHQFEVWKRLTERLALAGASVGERRTTPAEPEPLSGVIESIHLQRHQQVLLMRLDTPGPGVAMLGTSGTNPAVNVSVMLYFYGDDAGARARTSEPKWQRWLGAQFSTEARKG